ncbi:hypothetical protein FC778_05365 [Clostridium botulinum]|nr:hypothetical protein [Clostridium botulinum]
MEFISAEEFLKQPVGVQRVFLEWWKPSKGDLIQKVITDFITFVRDGDNKRVLLSGYSYGIDKFKELYILLPTEGQLRKFIEDKTIYKLEITQFEDGEWSLCLYKHGSRVIEIDDMDLFKAYWKVACEIANKEVVEHGQIK